VEAPLAIGHGLGELLLFETDGGEIGFAAEARFGGQLVHRRGGEMLPGLGFALMLFDDEFFEPIVAGEGLDLFKVHMMTKAS
jgi:hypothetical protein